ncbi:MAG: carboxypeptidase regulatory-like domain-containing protein [Chloroflexi bacterium]|nr:carboxypeptidase regulatory-like domain-containing protein [Chloroflexota bacterium]
MVSSHTHRLLVLALAGVLAAVGIFVLGATGEWLPPAKVALAQTDVTLSGLVRDNQNAPFVGAEVQVLDPGTGQVVRSTLTDATGRYSLLIPPGTYNIRVVPPSGSGFQATLVLGQSITSDTTMDFILVPAGAVRLSGRVLDRLGVGVPGVNLSLWPAGGGSSASTNTDQAGNYSLQVSSGQYTLSLWGSYSTGLAVPRSYSLGTSSLSLTQNTVMDITIPAKRVSVHVQDMAGNPVANVSIGTNWANNNQLTIGILPAWGGSSSGGTTDASGDTILWLFPTVPGSSNPMETYVFTATPPPGSPFAAFSVTNVTVLADKTEVIVLQFVHEPPVTSASVSPPANADGSHSGPVTVTLSATAFQGYSVASTYYSVDGPPVRTYSGPFVVSGDGTHTINYRSVDNIGVYEMTRTLTIRIVSNRPPTAQAGGPYSVAEGSAVTLNGSGADPDGDPITFAWDLDGNGSFETTGQNPSASTLAKDGPRSQAVTLQVCDNKAACAISGTTVSVTNVVPTVTAPAGQVATEGSAGVFNIGSFIDPGPDAPWRVEVDWADLSARTVYGMTTAGSLGVQPHTFRDNGVYSVTVKVTDKDGGVGTASFPVAVANVAPTVGPIAVSSDVVSVRTVITFTVRFTDPGVLDTHMAVWDWGDGTTSPGTVGEVNGSGSVTGTHAHASAGLYTVKVTVTDKDGGAGQSFYRYVVVFDPAAGFVTGGGWIESPAGSLVSARSSSGRSSFGFNARYQGNPPAPNGEVEFQFQAGGLNFHSTNLDWVVVAGAKAYVKGSGRINGAGSYAFMLTVVDGQIAGGGRTDAFRMRIWDQATGAVVYDNQMGADAAADPTTVLAGGSIVIHGR